MTEFNDIKPLAPVWPARPWNRRSPRRDPAEENPSPEGKRKPANRRDKADDGTPHIDEYA